MKKIAPALLALAVLLIPGFASAHVVVTPDTAKVGDYVTFNVSVPNEKDVDVTGLQISIPSGVVGATPTVKPGWTISTDQTGTGEAAVVKSISWTAGSIPAGQRDDFSFRAQAPAKSTELDWKAVQTYGDGSTVNWDQKPTAKESESETAGPYSVTKVIDDLTTAPAKSNESSNSTLLPTVLASVALILAVISLLRKPRTV